MISLRTAAFALLLSPVAGLAETGSIDFNRDIRPILSRNCYACHGPDEEARKGDLRLDTLEGATADLGGYASLVPGDADASELVVRIETDDEDDLMPPPKSDHVLTDEEKAKLRSWVEAGAGYDPHWSFEIPRKADLPPVSDRAWAANAVDHFVLARIEEAGLKPSPQADPHRLLRRLSLDLTGLPPTIEEADAFAADPSPEAFAAAVERLLGSQAFGEHWARMWLDLARYADTKGYEKDRPRTIWPYRDWVIEALNQDMPLDEFTLLQLAGDLLPDSGREHLAATAFHRNTMSNDEGGTDDEEFRVAAVKDRVDTTMQVWMGLTMGCAKCHTHKYDPISIDDYYATYAILNQCEDADRGNDTPTAATPTPQQSAELTRLEAEVVRLDKALAEDPTSFPGFAEAFGGWREGFGGEKALWTAPLKLAAFESVQKIALEEREDGILVAPRKVSTETDRWTLELELPAGEPLTAFRIETFPRDAGEAARADENFTLYLKAFLTAEDAEPQPIKLANARADFSQGTWEVHRAIDDDPKRGWAVSPKAAEPHVAIFDFAKPITAAAGTRLRLVCTFPYGKGLLPTRLRFRTSSAPTRFLLPVLDAGAGLEKTFFDQEFEPAQALQSEREKAVAALESVRKAIPNIPVLRELPADKRRTTHVHLRGNFLDQDEEVVGPAIPVAFGELPEGAPADRVALARWLCSDTNPLTARVMANRIWARLFGTGIVETEEDFGAQGTVPSHPELLDWLAVDYRENGWSLKSLLRSLVTSRTYQQSARTTPEGLAADPRNRLLARGPRFRLSAETVRDQALAASGLLTRKIGGPSVMPPQPPGVWKSTYSGDKWKNAEGPDRYRRGLYTFLKRTSPHPAMTAFDAGSGEVCQIRRVRTNTPLQSLITLNDPAFLEAAGALSQRMAETGGELRDQIAHGFRRVLLRPPSGGELDRLLELHAALGADLEPASFLASAGLKQGDPALVAVASVILNLDEALMKP